MNRSTIDLWVGIFVVIGIGAIVFLALRVGNLTSLQTAPSYRLEAAFDNIGGLKLRAPLKAAGVVVGRVEQVRFDPKTYQAVVTMKIDQGYQFSKDTNSSTATSCGRQFRPTWITRRRRSARRSPTSSATSTICSPPSRR